VTLVTRGLEFDTDDSLQWQAKHSLEAASYLRALPGFDDFRSILLGTIAAGVGSYPPRRAGDRWFQRLRRNGDDDQVVLVVRTSPTGEPRVLVDPNALTAERGLRVSLAWFAPSPDGRLLAFGLTEAGTEVVAATVLDVATGAPLPDVIPWNITFEPAWMADGSGFYCSSRDLVDGVMRMSVYRFTIGQPAPDQAEALPEVPFPAPMVSADGRYVAIRTGNTQPRTEYVRKDGGEWEPFLRDVPGAHLGEFCGDDYIAIVDADHPRGRVVRIPVATASDPSTWVELVPESDEVLRMVKIVAGRIVLGYLRAAACGVRVLDLDGQTVDEVDLPGTGVVDVWGSAYTQLLFPLFEVGAGEISFLFSTPTSSPALYRYSVDEGELEELVPSQLQIPGLVVDQIEATSRDGTRIPATVIYRSDLDLSGPRPTLIHGYGGYNVGLLRGFLGNHVPWASAGGILVLAHLRGGSELGADWWLQGRRERKQHTFDDLYAIAGELIRRNYTSPAHLAIEGASNGGTLTGAALVQRPDLWASVVSQVPQLDLLGFARDPVGYAIARVEYGDPLIPEEAQWLLRLSPRHNIKKGTAYPATLITAGGNDPRCPAWHARVMVAELQEATSGESPILLRTYGEQGHGAAGFTDVVEQAAEWLTFAAHHTGLKP
jgi:prolyl oligopeptidase